MATDTILFLGLALIAVLSAISMLVSRRAVYSALFLVINFVDIAILYLALNAPFIAMVQITVYAGAIMVLFLFVIMLIGTEAVETEPSLAWQRPLAILLGIGLVGEFVYLLGTRPSALGEELQSVASSFGSPAEVGRALFSEYLVPFEVTGVLLLVAMVGAIVITRDPPAEQAE
jgi:NADH-quinone oxidoreductase subunit J